MCGRLNITDAPGVRALCEQLDISLWPEDSQRFARFVRATDTVSVVFEQRGERVMKNAIWWLLLEPGQSAGGQRIYKPSRYTSFNTRYDKLNKPGSAGYKAFREQRCIIPVRGFGESQKTGSTQMYHDMVVADDGAMAMGGLYRSWQYKDAEGDLRHVYSCSVVTLPPHPKLVSIHKKSTPLMLALHDGSIARWLDEDCTDPDQLADLTTPTIRQPLIVTPIDKPSSYNQTGDRFMLSPD